MTAFFITLAVIAALVPLLLYLAIQGRAGQPALAELRRWRYAHRGLHSPGVPENSLAAFRAARDAGYGVELDVHITQDGKLVVIHDATLDRVTGEPGTVEELTLEQLQGFRLEGTKERIPVFSQVLELFHGSAPLIVELKPNKGNYRRLCEAACRVLDRYSGLYCVESFDPRCLLWLKKHRPDIVRGQLTENYFAPGRPKMPWILRWMLTHNMGNFLTRPDFVAYRFTDRECTVTNRLCRKRIAGVTWTITSQEDLKQAELEGWIPIFEGFLPK